MDKTHICLQKYNVFAFHNATKRHQAEKYPWSKNADTFQGINNMYFPDWLEEERKRRKRKRGEGGEGGGRESGEGGRGRRKKKGKEKNDF